MADQVEADAVVRELFEGIDRRFEALNGAIAALTDVQGVRVYAIKNLPGVFNEADFAVIRRYERIIADYILAKMAHDIQHRADEFSPDFLEGYRLVQRDLAAVRKTID